MAGAQGRPRSFPDSDRREGFRGMKVHRLRVAGWFLGVSVASGALIAGLALPVVGGAAVAATKAADDYQNLPADLPLVPPAAASVLLAGDGTRIATFYDQDRISEPLA